MILTGHVEPLIINYSMENESGVIQVLRNSSPCNSNNVEQNNPLPWLGVTTNTSRSLCRIAAHALGAYYAYERDIKQLLIQLFSDGSISE